MADECVDDPGGLTSEELIVAAGKAQTISNDGITVTKRSLSELIALDKHLGAKRAACRGGGWGSIGIARGIPPGTVANEYRDGIV